MIDDGNKLILLTLQKQFIDALQLRSQHPDDFNANIIFLGRVQLIEKSIYDLFYSEINEAKSDAEKHAAKEKIRAAKNFIYDEKFKKFYGLCFSYNSCIANATATYSLNFNLNHLNIFTDSNKEFKWNFVITFKDGSHLSTNSISDPDKLRKFKSAFGLKVAGTATTMLANRHALKS